VIKTIYRLFIYIFSKFIKTDELSEKFPISIKAFVIDKKRVLCLKNERNEWDFPGGKINFNENPEDCLKREVKEETNLEICDLKILKSFNLRVNNVPVFIVVYSTKISSNSPLYTSFEHTDYKFFFKSDIIDLDISSDYKNLLLEIL